MALEIKPVHAGQVQVDDETRGWNRAPKLKAPVGGIRKLGLSAGGLEH